MNMLIALVIGIVIGVVLIGYRAIRWRRYIDERLRSLSVYLERAVAGEAPVLETSGEDEISQLQDEISKTVTALEHSRRQALQDKEAFAKNLANIAHQIKTPLATISVAVDKLPNDERKNDIRRQLNKLTQLQTDLLLMAKLDTGALAFNIVDCDAYTLLATAADGLEELARRKQVTLDIEEHSLVTLQADPHWMCEAISNVMKNCIEHAPAASSVNASYAVNALYVEINVSDSGPGFSEEDLAHLFERFYHGSGTDPNATGLGLAFARQLIEAQNGTIEVENKPDGGAVFKIRIYRHPIVTLPR